MGKREVQIWRKRTIHYWDTAWEGLAHVGILLILIVVIIPLFILAVPFYLIGRVSK